LCDRAAAGDPWLRADAASPTAPSICLGVSNADKAGLNADLLGRFDYIEVAGP
jgi:hypothetical protein